MLSNYPQLTGSIVELSKVEEVTISAGSDIQ